MSFRILHSWVFTAFYNKSSLLKLLCPHWLDVHFFRQGVASIAKCINGASHCLQSSRSKVFSVKHLFCSDWERSWILGLILCRSFWYIFLIVWVSAYVRNVLACGCLYIKCYSRMFKEFWFFKFWFGFLITNCRDFVCLRHSASLNSPEVSGIRPLLLHVLILPINRAFLTAKLSS